MQSVVQSLALGVRGLRADLELADVLLAALEQRYEGQPGLREYVRRARRLTYSSTIISCYGLIEQTIDLLLVGIAETYNRFIPTFGDIPDSVRVSHRELLLQSLRDGERARTRSPVVEKDVIAALALEASDAPGLVPAVFTLSTANYRSPYVRSLFGRAGVDAEGGLYHGRAEESLAKAGFANYESFMEDLVQRRNDLAHSFGDDDIIDRDLLGAYVEISTSWLLDLVRLSNLFAIRTIRDWSIEPVATVAKAWTGIIGVDVEVDSIAVGDRILLYKGDWCTSHEVQALQSLGVNGDKFTFTGEVLQVGAMVDTVPAGAEGCEVFVMNQSLAEFWPSEYKWGPEALA